MSIREEMLKEAIGKAASPKLEDVAAQLPGDFDLDADELSTATGAPDIEAQIVELDNKLIELRQAARVRQNDLGAARGKLADAVRAYSASGRTQESVTRDWIAENQKQKQAAADGVANEPARPTPGDSHLDRIRSGLRGNSRDRGFGPGAANRIVATPWGLQRTGKYGDRVK
jgi:hypothetical protein